jgi:uncharacterized heparinase superfamily protein
MPGLVAGDPEVARNLYRGRLAFAGQLVSCQPAALFDVSPPNGDWTRQVHGFGWLADLAAADLGLYRAHARHLVQLAHEKGLAADLEVVCDRLISVSRHAGFLLQGAPASFETTLLAIVNADMRRLVQSRVRTPLEALLQSAAVLAAALSFSSPPGLRREALMRTTAAATSVILPDGGPVDRSPRTLTQILGLLVPLRSHIAAQRLELPQELNAAIERALPMLRMLCLGDGALVTFQGVNGSCIPLVNALLASDQTLGRPLEFAPHSGYVRLSQGETTAILDCGGPSEFDSALAFEFSDGLARVVTSCGVPPHAPPAWVEAARGAAAHSTLALHADGGVRLAGFMRRKTMRNKPLVTSEYLPTPHGALFKGCSLRHSACCGVHHVRELFLAAHGNDLRGEDRFERTGEVERGWADQEFALRFHLHPGVQATPDTGGKGMTLTLANGAQWQFSARGGDLTLEESLFVATGGSPSPCQQLVIRGRLGRPDIVHWAFRRTPS